MQSELDYSELLPDYSNSRSTISSILKGLDAVALDAVSKARRWKCALSFSAGIDSSIMATLFSQTCNVEESVLITLGAKDSMDVRESSSEYEGMKWVCQEVSKERIENAAINVSKIVDVSNLAHFEDCSAFYLIAEELSKHSWKFERLLTANGTDEVFCGYDRFKRYAREYGYGFVEQEISRSLIAARMLKKQVGMILARFGLEAFDPFLEDDFVSFACGNIPSELKILKDDDRLRKRIWRLYGRSLGIPEKIVLKPKKAMQFSMGIDKVIRSMIKRNSLKLNS